MREILVPCMSLIWYDFVKWLQGIDCVANIRLSLLQYNMLFHLVVVDA